MSQFDYNRVLYSVVTAKRAAGMGLQPSRHYGYYVLSDRVLPARKNRIVSWCKTKAIAEKSVAEKEEDKRRGYNSCPCGSGKQRRCCCAETSQVVYDEARFRKLIELDMFLKKVTALSWPESLEVLFNTYVRGDSGMERLYNERCAS
jgi:hypothetical protein